MAYAAVHSIYIWHIRIVTIQKPFVTSPGLNRYASFKFHCFYQKSSWIFINISEKNSLTYQQHTINIEHTERTSKIILTVISYTNRITDYPIKQITIIKAFLFQFTEYLYLFLSQKWSNGCRFIQISFLNKAKNAD